MSKYKKDKTTEEKILEAARKVFVHKGMYGARMQDIADEAGINKALLHYYFKNKQKLFEEIFMEAAGQLFPRVNAIFVSEEPLFTKIEKFCDEVIAANPESVADFKNGKAAALNFLKGQVMKLSKGTANPAVVGEILERKLT